jgi:hypothetical protein
MNYIPRNIHFEMGRNNSTYSKIRFSPEEISEHSCKDVNLIS